MEGALQLQFIKLIIISCFFSPILVKSFWITYILFIFIAAYLYFNEKNNKICHSFNDRSAFFLISFLVLVKILEASSIVGIIYAKNYIGLIFFYFLFKYYITFDLDKILIKLIVFTSICQLVVNFNDIKLKSFDLFSFVYKRPVGFGENSTVTAGVIVVFLFYINLKNESKEVKFHSIYSRLLSGTLLITASGVGYIGLLYYQIFDKIPLLKKRTLFLSITVSIAAIVYLSIFYIYEISPDKANPLYKISPHYIIFLLELKLNQISAIAIDTSSFKSFMIGENWNINHSIGDDFGWLDVFKSTGILGIIASVTALVLIIKNPWLRFFILLSQFHYGYVWWSAGQIFLGYILARENALKIYAPSKSFTKN